MENIQGHEMLNLRKVYPDPERDIEPSTDIGLAQNRNFRDYIQAKRGAQTNGHTNGHTNGQTNGHTKPASDRDGDVRKVDTIVVGAGQAGLSAAGYLKALELDAVVVEKNKEIGDNWTNRYDSLYLHTPHRFSKLFALGCSCNSSLIRSVLYQTILPLVPPSTTRSIVSGSPLQS